ncbi:MAG: O-antigen ligase family protein, partial [Acidobacteria bacterium]|nr:O-antigen ligase family protein [Acidobacteriota bacterium]
EQRSRMLAAGEISLVLTILIGVAIAQAFPFRPVKYGLIAFFAAAVLAQTAKRPALALALVAFALPAIDLVPPSLFVVRGLNAETILLVFALVIWVRARQVYGPDRVSSPLAKILFLYAIVILVASVRSWMLWKVSLFDIVAAAKNHLIFMLLLPVAFHTLREKRDQYLLVSACMLSLLLNCFQAINYSWLAFFSGALERHRAQALIALQPNLLGATLAMYMPVLFVLGWYNTGPRAMRALMLVTLPCAAFAMLLTLSRGAWLGIAAGVLVIALLRARVLLILVLVMAATSQFWVPQQVADRVAVTDDVDEDAEVADAALEGSAQMRVEQYKSMWPMMQHHPILGWGYKSFPVVFERYGTLRRSKGAHTSYVQVGTEAGVVGLAALGLVLVGMLWAGLRAALRCEDPFYRWLGVGIVGGTIAMAVSMITGARFEPQKVFAWFWIMIAIAEREALLVRDKPRRSDLSVVNLDNS